MKRSIVDVISQNGDIIETRSLRVSVPVPLISPSGVIIGWIARAKDGHIWRPVRKDNQHDNWRMWQ